MEIQLLLKIIFFGLLIAFGEVINGNIRVRVLYRKFGKSKAKIVSFFSGIVIVFTICLFASPWINPSSYLDCVVIGFIWLVIMMCLDIYFGRYVFKFKWDKIFDDFNPMKGNLLSIGMLFLLFFPTIVFWFYQ